MKPTDIDTFRLAIAGDNRRARRDVIHGRIASCVILAAVTALAGLILTRVIT